jgi:AraC-like DNA-binding protein
MSKIVFSSDALPPQLDDAARFRAWSEVCTDVFCAFDLSRPDDQPFAAAFEFSQFGDVGIGMFRGTLSGVARTERGIAADGSEGICVGINLAATPLAVSQDGRETVLEPGRLVLLTHFDAWRWHGAAEASFVTWNAARSRLAALVPDPERLIASPLDPQNEASRHLRRYSEFLLGAESAGADPRLAERIGATLLDLMALSLGAVGDAASLAKLRGLRAARVRQILAEIQAGFADPSFSSGTVAKRLGVSPRYINDLLHETGTSLIERVMELRLQKARAMLSGPRHDRLKVSEIAYACGFNEVSYFNRCFRRRFGASPTQFRGNNGAPA